MPYPTSALAAACLAAVTAVAPLAASSAAAAPSPNPTPPQNATPRLSPPPSTGLDDSGPTRLVKAAAAAPKAAARTALDTASGAGAAFPGSTAYPVPGNAVHVALWGNDSAAGTANAPVRTLARALQLAPWSGTIVMRQGNYRESVDIYKPVTVQSAPGEQVWLDGAPEVSGWTRVGNAWRHDGWTAQFDHSPTYTKGAPDSTSPHWQFLNPKTPLAAHPDGVWIDGYQQWQVGSAAAVTPGTFYVDDANDALYIGTDPSGHTVNASTLTQAAHVRSSDVTLRGIGIRRYATSVWMVGAITLEKPRITLEDVVVSDIATTGISIQSSDATLDNVTVQWSGMLGIQGRYADRTTLRRVVSTRNNAQRFNLAPVSGGAKFVKSRGLTVTDSSFSGNFGHGFWTDMSVYDTTLARSDFSSNSGNGVFLEISAKATVAGNTFLGNTGNGLMVNNTTAVSVWNNTLVGNARPLNIVQDTRRNTARWDVAVDERQPWPNADMPWTLGPVRISNNVVGAPSSSANCLLCVEDYSFSMSGSAMGIHADGNVYNRRDGASPTWLAVWASGGTNPYVLTSLTALRSRAGVEGQGLEVTGREVVTSTGLLADSVAAQSGTTAHPLPSGIASVVGQPVGVRHLGAW